MTREEVTDLVHEAIKQGLADSLPIAVQTAVDVAVNGKQQRFREEVKRDNDTIMDMIGRLDKKIAPFDAGKTWITQLIKGVAYIGVPSGSIYAIYKIVRLVSSIIIR